MSVLRGCVPPMMAVVPLLLALACGGAGSPTASSPPLPAPTPTPSPSVVVVSVDGLRGDAVPRAAAPNLQGLTRRGAFSLRARTIYPSITLPSHSSMLSGVEPAVHRLLFGEYSPDRGYIGVPTVFSIARGAGLRTVMVVGKEKFKHLAAPGTVDSFVLTGRGDEDVANEAVVQVQAGFDLMFVHFPETDLTGHAKGWMSAEYLAHVARMDQALGRLLTALSPHTTVIVSADHGGRGTSHGSESAEDMTIPWIIAGPKVVAGRELTSPIRTLDTAATALHVLGLQLPASATGLVVREAFVSP